MEKKQAKFEARQQQEEFLRAKKLKELEKERIIKEKERQKEEEQMKEDEALRKLKEDQEKKESEEYDKWKDGIIIEEEGENIVDINDEGLINEFLNYIKLRKVVSLEDLSGQFKLPATELIDRLKFLESQNRICGIIDDRGKYIFITEKELAVLFLFNIRR